VSAVFHLIRHAAHEELGRILTGRGPTGLSETGRAEARALGRQLASLRIDAILSSPRRRATETAELIAAATGQEPEIEEGLDEIDFGPWAGLPFAELAGDPDWRAWNEERDKARTPGGETMAAVARRLAGSIDRLRAEHPARTVALVSHSDVIKAGVCHYLGLPFGRVHRFEISPASITTLVVADWGGTLIALNERCPSDPEEPAA
jgi:broad specificity phosphatase PhoE